MDNIRLRIPIHRAWIAAIAICMLFAPEAKGQSAYQLDGFSSQSYSWEAFNALGVGEDDFVANSFAVLPGAQTLTSITFLEGSYYPGSYPGSVGFPFYSETFTAAIYAGASLTDPSAGGGLQRIVASTNTVTVTLSQLDDPRTFITIPLAQPITLPVGQVFYAAMLAPDVNSGTFPFADDFNEGDPNTPYTPPLGRSFFDFGTPYNLDDTSNLTVFGGNYPGYGDSAGPSPSNLILRVNAVPEPGMMALWGACGIVGLSLLARRRKRR